MHGLVRSIGVTAWCVLGKRLDAGNGHLAGPAICKEMFNQPLGGFRWWNKLYIYVYNIYVGSKPNNFFKEKFIIFWIIIQDKWSMKIKWKKSPTTISGVDFFVWGDSHQIGSKKSLQFFIVWLFTFPIGLIGTFASGQLQVERTRVRWSNDQRSSWKLSLV